MPAYKIQLSPNQPPDPKADEAYRKLLLSAGKHDSVGTRWNYDKTGRPIAEPTKETR